MGVTHVFERMMLGVPKFKLNLDNFFVGLFEDETKMKIASKNFLFSPGRYEI